MKNNIKILYVIVFSLFSSLTAFAEPGTEDTNGNLEGTDVVAAPIDNYVWILALLILGSIFAFYKVWKAQNQQMVIITNKI